MVDEYLSQWNETTLQDLKMSSMLTFPIRRRQLWRVLLRYHGNPFIIYHNAIYHSHMSCYLLKKVQYVRIHTQNKILIPAVQLYRAPWQLFLRLYWAATFPSHSTFTIMNKQNRQKTQFTIYQRWLLGAKKKTKKKLHMRSFPAVFH